MFIDGVLHGGAAEATRTEVELMTDATLGATVVDDLFVIRPVAPTSASQMHMWGFWTGSNGMSSSSPSSN
jgi:hypothetical protein